MGLGGLGSGFVAQRHGVTSFVISIFSSSHLSYLRWDGIVRISGFCKHIHRESYVSVSHRDSLIKHPTIIIVPTILSSYLSMVHALI